MALAWCTPACACLAWRPVNSSTYPCSIVLQATSSLR